MNATPTLLQQAQTILPGGVNSPVRAFGAVGGDPVFLASAKGPWLHSRDGRSFVDWIGSWGAMLFGHGAQDVVDALLAQVPQGISFGACTESEVLFAQEIQGFFPSMEMMRLVNSGTEATLSAVRVARGFTGREKIVKFRGCYHGHGDSFLIEAGSGALTHGVPNSAGVTRGTAMDTLILPYNHLDAAEELFGRIGQEIACVILEPVAGNIGVVPPAAGYLQGLRQLCDKHGAVLIFDEVMTGFRVAPGGAQELYGVRPDMTTLGKIVGAGLPVGAYGGRADIMRCVSPLGPVYQAGTLSGNPLAVAAGRAHLSMLRRLQPHAALEKAAALIGEGLLQAARENGIPAVLNRVGSMFTLFFTPDPVVDDVSAMRADPKVYGNFFRGMLAEGVYLAPSQYEALFLSASHGEAEIQHTLKAAHRVLSKIAAT